MIEATFTVKVNVRASASVSSADLGDIYAGDKVYGVVTGAWIKFSRIYRADGGLMSFTSDVYAAIQDPNNSTVKYAMLRDVPEPTPQPNPVPTRKPLTITFESEEFETQTITLTPK